VSVNASGSPQQAVSLPSVSQCRAWLSFLRLLCWPSKPLASWETLGSITRDSIAIVVLLALVAVVLGGVDVFSLSLLRSFA